MTATITEFDLTILEDMDFSRVCMPYHSPCGNEATWVCTKGCGCELPFCDVHKPEAEREITRLKNAIGTVIDCFICGDMTDPMPDDWFRWERV